MTSSEMKKFFKKQQIKSFFAIVKDCKRYYLGSLLWLNAFKILNNKVKMQKWQQKHKERYENLQRAIKKYKFTKNAILQSEIWLNSKEFKEKYLDTKHPYPPLLNPDSIDYEVIPAELAWEMNLPLPPYYDFLYISSGASGSAATFKFFLECKVNIGDAVGCKNYYMQNYSRFLTHKYEKNCLFSYCNYITAHQDSLKYRSILRKKPLLFIARDPIERLQHAINHLNAEGSVDHLGLYRNHYDRTINITCNYKFLFKNLLYEGENKTPSLNLLNFDVSYKLNKLSLYDTSTLQCLCHKASSIHLVEFNDIKADKAFDTFCKLADTLGFDKPTNKEIFTNRINRNRGALVTLPTTLYVHKDDLKYAFKEGQKEKRNLASLHKKGGFSIIITLPHYLSEEQKDFVDISDEIEPNLIIDDTKICIIIDKNELIKFKENDELFKASKDYLKGYVNALKDNAEQIKANLINETQIIEFLRCNDEARKNIKQILDTELDYIKIHHPEFIKKWKYYLEFEKMCAELDGKELSTDSSNR